MKETNQVLLHPANRCGANLTQWIDHLGGVGLYNALNAPHEVVSTIKRAGLRGLGGSGHPTHHKWQAMLESPFKGNRYLVCNGNEDEPGTFKDRLLLEETPHQVIEGALIAAITLRTNRVIFYINPDLKNALECMRTAISQWQDNELLLRCKRELPNLTLTIQASSGHYIGGEETAAMETVEGKFPFPRGKPPYPSEAGIEGCPTLINNIETIANLPHILREGSDWFVGLGLGNATGTKIYCLSGDVLYPGAYELPMGTPLRELIDVHGGGMLAGKRLKAVFTGGPSNTLLTPPDLDVPLDFESVKARRSSLGTGAMIVVSEGTGIVKRVADYVGFFAHSSCGQCPPCKNGTYYAAMLLERIDTGVGKDSDLEALQQLCRLLPNSGRCHLINGVVKLIESSFDHFSDEYLQALHR